MKRLLACFVLLASFVSAQDKAPTDLASLLPADTLMLIESDDLGGPEVWERETALGRVWAEPEVRYFFDKMYASIKQGLKQMGDPLKGFGLTLEDLEGIQLRRGGFALVDFRIKGETPHLDAVLYLEARKGGDKLMKVAAAARKAIEMPLGGFDTAKMSGRTVHRKAVTDWLTVYIVEDGTRVIVTTQAPRMVQLLAAIDGTRVPALSSNPRFQQIFAKMGAKRRALLGYVDVKAMLARADEMMPGVMGDDTWGEARKAIFNSGFDGVDAMAMADIPAGPYFRTEFAVTLREKRGMFAHGDATPPTGRFLRRAPRDAWICGEARNDLGDMIDGLLSVNPEGAEEFAEFEKEFKKRLGLEMRADLVDHMGSEWGYYLAAPPGGGLIPDLVVFNTVKDKAKLAASMAKLVAKLQEWAKGEGVVVQVRDASFRGNKIRFLEVAQDDGDPIPVSPAWVFGDDFVAFALVPQSLKHALLERTSIVSNEDFQSLRRHVPGAPVSLSYVDVGGFLEWAYNIAVPVLQAVQGGINRDLAPYGVRVNFEDLPPARVWRRHLGGMLSYSLVEKDVLRSGYVSAYGSTVIVIVPVTIAAGASVFFLTAGRAAEEAIAIEIEEAEEAEEKEAEAEEDHEERDDGGG